MPIPLLALLALVFIWSSPHQAESAEEELTLVYVASMAEVQPSKDRGGLPQLATLLKTLRRDQRHLLFLHGGGALSPSILATTDRGAHMISLLNLLQPDALAVAKSEFAHKEDELSQRAMEATFPLLVANISDPLSNRGIEGTSAWKIFTVGSYRIGIFSLVDPEVIADYMPNRGQIMNTEEVITATTTTLRQAGADLVILLADFRPPGLYGMLGSRIIDVALINDPALDPPADQPHNNYYEFNSNSGAACLFTLNLRGSGASFSFSGKSRTVPLVELTEDAEIKAKIDGYLSQLADILAVPLAVTRTHIDTSRKSLRSGENGFANLLADILREFYQSDCALINGGGIRGNHSYAAGTTLTRGDIHREIPFNNRVVNLEVNGRQLRESIENGLGRIEEGKGRFPHVSGMRIWYDPTAKPGQRVVRIHVADEELQPDKTYSLATLDYLAGGGDNYTALIGSKRLAKIGGGRLLWEYVRNGLVARGEIAPSLDGRLTVVGGGSPHDP
jgi:5'-nucleotidase / UDP-sugar diphosphatase